MKLSTTIIIILIITATFHCSSQTLFDLYRLLPEKIGLGNGPTREKMIKNFKEGNKHQGDIRYRFDLVDEQNGFLTVMGAFEGSWSMCYWNLPDNKKLVAVYYQGCGPVCYVESFDFFSYSNGSLTLLDRQSVIPEYETIHNDFFTGSSQQAKQELEKKDITTTLLFSLPRKGKDIIALFGNEDPPDTYSAYVKGNRMTLKWDNGKFKKDRIYWEK